MSDKFHASVQQRGDTSYVKLAGVIDEDNELGELLDKIPAGTAIIDLGEIERINSCGVRDWVNWLSRIESRGARPVFVECAPPIVAQINLVNNFTGSGVVKSFYVPYFCPECDEEKVLLVEAADMGSPPHEPPTCRCDECDLVMDFDDMPDSYFAFLPNQRKLSSPEQIDSAMRAIGREPAERTGAGATAKSKVRSRASQSTLSTGDGSEPKPELASLQRAHATSPKPHAGAARNPTGKLGAPLHAAPADAHAGGVPPGASASAPTPPTQPYQAGGLSTDAARKDDNVLVLVLVGVLAVAIVVLAYLVLTR